MTDAHENAHARSLREPDSFWAEAAEGIDWIRRFDRVLDDSRRRSTAGSPAAC